MKKKNDLLDDAVNFILVIFIIYIVCLFYDWFFNRDEFWHLAMLGIGVVIITTILCILIVWAIRKHKDKKWNNLLSRIKKLGLEQDIINFINRFGREKGRYVWKYMDYGFDFNRQRIFMETLVAKGLKIHNNGELKDILCHYIDSKEEAIMSGGFAVKDYKFLSLSGTDFESLLVRLFESMGYTAQHTGKTGDQGGDLILNKNGRRILIQAKRYINNIDNSAVQEAVAATKYYDCNNTAVVGTSEFTGSARQLARVDGVRLIDKKELQGLLLQYLKESWN